MCAPFARVICPPVQHARTPEHVRDARAWPIWKGICADPLLWIARNPTRAQEFRPPTCSRAWPRAMRQRATRWRIPLHSPLSSRLLRSETRVAAESYKLETRAARRLSECASLDGDI